MALLLRYWPHLLGAGLLAILAWQGYGWAYDNGYNAANVRAEKIIAEFARAEANAQERARAAEHKQAERQRAAAEAYERGKADAQAAADSVVADLRADRLRLREHWRGCETDRLSEAATRGPQLDADAELRRAGAGNLVRLADQCDAWIESLQLAR